MSLHNRWENEGDTWVVIGILWAMGIAGAVGAAIILL